MQFVFFRNKPSSFPVSDCRAVAADSDRSLRVHDHPGLGGQPHGDLRRGARADDANGAERVRGEPGHLGPDAVSHHNAAHPHRNSLPHVAVWQCRGESNSKAGFTVS